MKLYKIIIIFVLVAALCVGGISYSNGFTKNNINLINETQEKTQQYRYHFAVIAQNINESFWQSVKKGAQKAGQKHSAAIEFIGSEVQDEDEELKYLNIAIACNVDGIAVYVTDKSKFGPVINKAVGKGINVVTIESDDKNSLRQAYIGPNSYDIGVMQASLVAEAGTGKSNVAIILGGNYAENQDSSDELLQGFKRSIESNQNIKLKSIKNSGSSYFGAEKIIRNILYEEPDINTVVCTSADDTLEIARVLLDLNKTSDITVIGYNYSDQIRDYIKNGVIFGSVYENPEKTGSESIECLVNLLKGKEISSNINTGVYTVTRNNLINNPIG